jgi:hypothetical protein
MARQGLKRRPIYTPAYRQELGLYTDGKEWMYQDTLEEYIGLYHQYPNTATYSGAEWGSDSRLLIPYAEQTKPTSLVAEDGKIISDASSKNNSTYFKITGTRFNQYYQPPFYYPDPGQNVYDVGAMSRFFVQKFNEIDNITEVNPEEYDRANDKNQPGIDGVLYNKVKLEWTIVGPLDEVRKANARVLKRAELDMPGITSYLSDLDEFHKNRHKIKS